MFWRLAIHFPAGSLCKQRMIALASSESRSRLHEHLAGDYAIADDWNVALSKFHSQQMKEPLNAAYAHWLGGQ